jgi:MFS family permease
MTQCTNPNSNRLSSAPPFDRRDASPSSPTVPDVERRIRRSLSACTAEGVVTEVVNACFGNAMATAWAVHLGAGPLFLGLLWALPYFGQLFQIPAAWLTSHFGRRRVAILGKAASRQVLLPLVALPFLSVGRETERVILVVALAISALCVVIGHNAWLSWMGDMVPARIRGRYFGRRTAMCTIGGTASALVSGIMMDVSRAHGAEAIMLAVITLLGALVALAAPIFMRRQHDPEGAPSQTPTLRDVAEPFVQPMSRRLLAYQAVWNVGFGIAAAAYAVHMLQTLRIGFVGMAVYNAVLACARVLAAPLWGKLLDRFGARPVIAACSLGSALSTSLWLWAGNHVWPFMFEAVLSGAFLGGQELSMFALPLAVAPREKRPVYLAAFVMVGGVAFGLASVGGGAFAAALPAFGAAARYVLFTASSLGRFAACVAALKLQEPGAPASDPILELLDRARAIVRMCVERFPVTLRSSSGGRGGDRKSLATG